MLCSCCWRFWLLHTIQSSGQLCWTGWSCGMDKCWHLLLFPLLRLGHILWGYESGQNWGQGNRKIITALGDGRFVSECAGTYGIRQKMHWDGRRAEKTSTAGKNMRKPTPMLKLVNSFPTPAPFTASPFPSCSLSATAFPFRWNKKKDFSLKIQQKCQGLAPGRIKSARQWQGKHLKEIILYLEL